MSQLSEQVLEKIDLYLTNKLSPIESTQFESEIASDPVLSEEVNFQKDIINSIKSNRQLELKSRLQGIEVSSKSKWFSKSFLGGVAAATILGTAGFIYYQYTKNDDNPHRIAENESTVLEFTPKTISTEENQLSLHDETTNDITSNDIQATSNTVEDENNTETESINYNDINVPEIELNANSENEISTNSLATIDNLESVEIMKGGGASEINIEFYSPNAKKLAYKFYDQKLYLFGKFNTKNPYEVIEINTKFGKEFYLKFDKSYYTIKKGIVDKTPLIKVENSQLIEKLNGLN